MCTVSMEVVVPLCTLPEHGIEWSHLHSPHQRSSRGGMAKKEEEEVQPLVVISDLLLVGLAIIVYGIAN